MANRNGDLILHLKLDDINTKESTVSDSIDPKVSGKVVGASVVADYTFGKCLSFDGKTSFIEIPDCEQLRIKEYTVMVWINPNRTPSMQGVIGKKARNFNIWLNANGSIHHAYTEADKSYSQTDDTSINSIKWNEWNHIAITNDGVCAKTYINGIELSKTAGKNLIVREMPLTIGRNLNGQDSNYFSGKMAHVRIYRQALSEAGIAEDMKADINAHDLIVYLKLDDINTRENTVADSFDPKMKGKVVGASLVPDDIFGACLSFDGNNDNVQIPDCALTGPNPAHTIEAWIKAEAPKKGRSCILVLGQYGRGSHHWLLKPKTPKKGELQIGPWLLGGQLNPDFPLQEWTHLAASYADGKLKVYINGILVGEAKPAAFDIIDKNLTLATKLSAVEENFKGSIAHLRLYRKALTAEEIKADMDADKMALPAYRDAHPIAFSLCDENENYVLYIDDDPKNKQPLILELRNTSARAIKFGINADKVSDKNYHFELVFRSGTLSERTLKMLSETSTEKGKNEVLGNTEKWDVYSRGEDKQSGKTSLYLYYKDSNNFNPNQRLIIPLHNINAQAGIGARGTRVELRLNQLTYDEDNVAITGSRVQHLQIINHLGSRRMPLHVSFVGSNRVLNDAASLSPLTLQLMNVLRSEFDTTVTMTSDSKLLIAFDVEATSRKEVAPWSLCTEEEIKTIDIIVAKTDKLNRRSRATAR